MVIWFIHNGNALLQITCLVFCIDFCSNIFILLMVLEVQERPFSTISSLPRYDVKDILHSVLPHQGLLLYFYKEAVLPILASKSQFKLMKLHHAGKDSNFVYYFAKFTTFKLTIVHPYASFTI